MPSIPDRTEAVETTLTRIRRAGDRLEEIQTALTELARHAALFPYNHFPIEAGSQGGIFRLAGFGREGPTLYLSVGRPGRHNLPHTHPTWSVVAGVRGVERNYIYDRVDDGQVEGRGILRLREEVDVGPGEAIALRPGEFHYIVVTSEATSLQLHAYGAAIERWTGVLPVFPTPDSGVYDLIPAPLPGLRIEDPVGE